MSYFHRDQRWYTNVYVIISGLISVVALSMAGLVLLLLPKSSEVVRIMQWRMVNAKSFKVATDISWRGDVRREADDGTVTTDHQEFEARTQGYVDRWLPDETKHWHAFRVSAGDKRPLVFAGDYRRIGEANFLSLNDMPGRLGTFQLGRYRDRWLRMEPSRLFAKIDSPFIPKESETMDEFDEAYLVEQFRITPFLSVKKKLRGERIGGVATNHYEVEPELLYFKDYFIVAQTLRLGRELTNAERLKVETFFADVTPESGELWIGRGDYYLYRMRLRFRYDDGTRSGVLDLTANFSEFNLRPDIKVPEGEVQDIQPILRSLLPSLVSHLPLAKEGGDRVLIGEEGSRGLGVEVVQIGNEDPDGDRLPNALELFYGSDPNNPDTDGDGVGDGDEVQAGRNPTGPGSLFDFGITEFLERGDAPADPSPAPATEDGDALPDAATEPQTVDEGEGDAAEPSADAAEQTPLPTETAPGEPEGTGSDTATP